MAYHPIFLDIEGKPSIVIGGGAVAERKISSLLDGGAVVTVVSPDVTAGIEAFYRSGRITLHRRPYQDGDLKGHLLAYSATNRREVNRAVREEAERAGVLLNVVDDPALCDFITPAVVRRGSLLVAVSTSGRSPAIARKIRGELEALFGEEYAPFLELVGAIRMKLLKKNMDSVIFNGLYAGVMDSPLLEWLRDGKVDEIDAFLDNLLGDGYRPSQLGVRIGK
ncbi:MAG: bifunctional precorrin-2 dehydrogenase/sirohydrochlorin ferrochelatase [Thermodesulfobacteriota bacterium]